MPVGQKKLNEIKSRVLKKCLKCDKKFKDLPGYFLCTKCRTYAQNEGEDPTLPYLSDLLSGHKMSAW